jgi:hypothetical protein
MRHAILLSLIAVGCGGSGAGDDDVTPGDGNNTPDGEPIPEGYTRLLGRSWSLAGGQLDTYKCVRFTVPEDTYITSIVAQAPFGTHHTVLTFAGANGTAGPDGEQDCSVGTLGTVMLYASGVGTEPLDFPTDVGLKIPAGQKIHLNLHLFNATDEPINGDTAILVKSQATPTPTLAEMAFAGKIAISIPSDPNKDTTLSGGCTTQKTFNIFGVWPHQHKLGTHHKFAITRNGVETVLHDDAYDFNEQAYYLQSPEFAVQPGDKLTTTCTWHNETGSNVTFGESSNDEMCFTGLYRYPAQNEGIAKCTDTNGFGF